VGTSLTVARPEGSLVWVLLACVVTVVMSRYITYRIRTGRGRFSDVGIGALHLHHMVWGVGLILICGTAQFAFRPEWPFDVAPGLGFGAGAALVLDEFALILYLRDVYWAREGRLSLAAVLVMTIALGMIALPLAPSHLPEYGRWIVLGLIVTYVVFTAICLAKGKILTSLGGLFIPAVVLYGAVRLARPNSPWARFWYGRNSKKRERALVRYDRTGVRARRRQKLLEILSGTEERLVASKALADRPVARGSSDGWSPTSQSNAETEGRQAVQQPRAVVP